MKTTRSIAIKERVFTITDLMRLASILDPQTLYVANEGASVKYEVAFEDGQRIEGTASEVFAEEELNRPSRPSKIEIWLRTPRGSINIQLRPGDSENRFENSVTIMGGDTDWVNKNYTALSDAVDKVTPQSFWWKRHRTLLLNIIALGIANIEDCTLGIIATITYRLWPQFFSGPLPPSVEGALWWYIILVRSLGPWLVLLPWCWLGNLLLAFSIRSWLLSMWPSIEFSFGSPYLRLENRRQKFNAFMALWVIPLIVAAIFEVAKSAVVK